jgi:hypothetical protein
VLDLMADRAPTMARMWAVVDLRNWAEDYEQHVGIAERCNRLLARPAARRFVAARLDRPDDVLRVWGVAESMGLDPWEAGWQHLDSRGIDSRLYARLARTPHPARWSRLVSHAERALPLGDLAAGPQDRLLPAAPDGEAAHALAGLVQEMRPGRWSAPLVAAALLSPVIFVRNGALRALEQTEPREWGAPVEAALHRLAELEPTAEVRARARAQAARLAS